MNVMRQIRFGAAPERKYAAAASLEVARDGTFEGYASLFGVPDLSGDVVEAGAFARSLRRRGASAVRMLFQHDPNQPIGRWTSVEEDAAGLLVRGQLALGSTMGREVQTLMTEGALDGLSIGFRTVRARIQPRTGRRHILEADLWEVSVVTFPMLPTARVTSMKGTDLSQRDDLTNLARQIRRASRTFTH